jgi:hypothetical protein
MEFLVKKTFELTENEQKGILSLFNRVFAKNRSLEYFNNQFVNNPLGYSYHVMMVKDGQIAGCDSYIPSYYIFDGKRLLFVNSVDTIVDKPYRDFFNFFDMVNTIHKYMKKEGIVFVYGFPNDNSYLVYIKSKLMKDIGNLTVYCLPYRIGGIRRKLKMFNWFSIAMVNTYVFFISLISGGQVHQFFIAKEAVSYNATRYKRLDGDYHIINHDGGFVYKLMEYEGVRSVFLIDVFEKSAVNFSKAVRYIIKNHSKEFDILLYVGNLPFGFHGLIQLPQRLSPKRFHFTGEILNDNEIDKEVFFNINNWDVNLSNYDLI